MFRIVTGCRDYVRAQKLLYQEQLWPVFLVPGILSLFYVPLVMVLGYLNARSFTAYVHNSIVPDFLQSSWMAFFVGLILWVLVLCIGFLLFRHVIMILYSPFLSFLSEATERKAMGQHGVENAPPWSWKSILHSTGRGTLMSVVSLLLTLIAILFFSLLSLIPILGIVASAVLLPAFTMFLAGLGFWDPTLERRHLTVGETFGHCWKHRGRVLGNGLVFTLLLTIPVIGWFLAPSFGMVAGTLAVIDEEKREASQ